MPCYEEECESCQASSSLPHLGEAGAQERDRQDAVGRDCSGGLHSAQVPMVTGLELDKLHLGGKPPRSKHSSNVVWSVMLLL